MRRKIVETQGLSLREAAEVIGYSHQRVSQLRKQLEKSGAAEFVSKDGYTRNPRLLKRDEEMSRILDAGGTIGDASKATGYSATILGHAAKKLGYRPCRWLRVEKIAEQYR